LEDQVINGSLKDVGALLREGISNGQGAARAGLGAGAAFYDLDGAVKTVANFTSHLSAAGMSIPVTFAAESGTPAGVVAEAGAKPSAVAVTQSTQSLKKFAGIAELTLEAALSADMVTTAVANVLNGSVLRAFETDAIAAITSGVGTTIAQPLNWVEGIATAQGIILANGGMPSCIIIPAVDWGAVATDILGTAAFSQSPESDIGALLGSPIHVSPTAPTGTALVIDSSAVQVVAHEESPLVILDATSRASTNEMTLVVDLICATFVSSAAKTVAVPAPGAP
jgi:hypothetical protein